VTKVVITAAGKGTRLLPFTKEMPKEMMPIFSQTFTKNRLVLPLFNISMNSCILSTLEIIVLLLAEKKDLLRIILHHMKHT